MTQQLADNPTQLKSARFWPNILKLGWSDRSANQKIAPLDGLRGLAVILTLTLHFIQPVSATSSQDPRFRTDFFTALVAEKNRGFWGFGVTGVELFFVLSGFLLFLPYSRAILGLTAFPSTIKFFVRRGCHNESCVKTSSPSSFGYS